ncbi:MAG: hypothetical protein AMJ43_07820 [Coxiella sp. DG_40]|nr:MAG: hypothetical protein AMJ43_07820 [Coxiella sp. DG_40]
MEIEDIKAGLKLREFRTMKGLSQTQLGEYAGVTFQQIQKYEKGLNRMGVSRLHQFAKALDVSVADIADPKNNDIDLNNKRCMLKLFKRLNKLSSKDIFLLTKIAERLINENSNEEINFCD